MIPGAALLIALAGAMFPEVRSSFYSFEYQEAAAAQSAVNASSSGVSVEFAMASASEAGRADLFEEAGGSPRWSLTASKEFRGRTFTFKGTAGKRILIAVRSTRRPGYLLEGPFIWPEGETGRQIADTTYQAAQGQMPPENPAERFNVITRRGNSNGVCEILSRDHWQCLAIPLDEDPVIETCLRDGTPALAERFSNGGKYGFRNLAWTALVTPVDSAIEAASDESLEVSLWKSGPAGGKLFVREAGLESRHVGSALWLGGGANARDSILRLKSGSGQIGAIRLEELLNAASCGARADVVLRAPERLAGTVADEDRRPLKGALVLAFEKMPSEMSQSAPRVLDGVETDESGKFILPGLEPGTYRIRACHASAGCGERMVSTAEPVEIVLSPKWLVRGRVVSSTNVPEPEATVRVLPSTDQYRKAPDRSQFIPTETTTEMDGRFAVGLSLAGNYVIEVRGTAGMGRRDVQIADVSNRENDIGDIRLSHTEEFTALLKGCAGGSVVFSGPMDGRTPLPSVMTFDLGKDERAPVTLPEPGSWLVWARCGGGIRSVDPAMLIEVGDLSGLDVPLVLQPAVPKSSH